MNVTEKMLTTVVSGAMAAVGRLPQNTDPDGFDRMSKIYAERVAIITVDVLSVLEKIGTIAPTNGS